MSDAVVVLMTAPSDAIAQQLADVAVEERLAACVAVIPGVRTVYRWQGKIERAHETQLICKTTKARAAALQARLVEVHPYDVPECLVLDVVAGLPAYLQWMVEETR